MNIHPRQARTYLWAFTAMALLGTVTLIGWAIAWSDAHLPTDEKSSAIPTAKVAASTKPATDALPSLKDFAQVWQKPLRRPLFDPPPSATTASTMAAAAVPVQPLKIQLLGTAVESSGAVGMFRLSSGEVEIRGVGETVGKSLDAAEVTAVQDNGVQLRHQGRMVMLKLEPNLVR